MAEKAPRTRKRRPGQGASDTSDTRSGARGGSGPGLSGAQLAKRARQELADITGLEPEGVTSLERSEDGTWKVTVEMLELERIPPTDDVLGSYQADLDDNGELVGYERVDRYTRSQVGSGQRGERGS